MFSDRLLQIDKFNQLISWRKLEDFPQHFQREFVTIETKLFRHQENWKGDTL